jgi:hypothetical protein
LATGTLYSGEPFHRCTHTLLSPKGEIYVSDGYVARDMGGTSFDVSLIATGGPALSAEKDIAYGVPLDFIP